MESTIKAGHCAFCKTYIRKILSSGPHLKTKSRFCQNCGKQIWTICEECGENLRYDDRICEACGHANPIFLDNDPDYYGDTVEEI
jgi:hypothetical protein